MQTLVEIRPLESGDSIEELTALINRAYAVPAAAGVALEGANQKPERTKQRVDRGACLVATLNGQLVGTLTISAGWHDDVCPYLGKAGVACRYQLAVAPELHGAGVGYALRQESDRWARELYFKEMVGFTPINHTKQIESALRSGATIVARVQWAGDDFFSVVYSKLL